MPRSAFEYCHTQHELYRTGCLSADNPPVQLYNFSPLPQVVQKYADSLKGTYLHPIPLILPFSLDKFSPFPTASPTAQPVSPIRLKYR